MPLIDWNSIWDNQMLITDRSRLNDGLFWDSVAKEGRRGCFPEDFTEFQMECLGLEGGESVLEIGPGKGRLTRELAKRAASLTVVDPSKSMLDELTTGLKTDGFHDVRAVMSKWEEADITEMGGHDVVVASYSLFMMDMRRMLGKMTGAADDRVCIFVPADNRIPVELQRILHGSESDIQMPDHVVLFNLLWQMGLPADVLTRDFEFVKEYEDLQSAVDEQMRFHNVPEDSRGDVEGYISPLLDRVEGGLVLRQQRRTAMLSWGGR